MTSAPLAEAALTQIAEFAAAAAAYCDLLDRRPDAAASHCVVLAKVLSRLHGRALELPDVFDDGAPEPETNFGPPEPLSHWVSALNTIGYWDIFDPLILEPDQPVFNSIDDDLGDIYRDLRRGLHLYRRGYAAAAAWEWRFGFLTHWGEHLVGLERAIFLASRR